MLPRSACALIALAAFLCGIAPGSARAEPTYTVDSTLDQIDADVSDGVCATAAGTCTLRAAIMQANRVSGVGATIHVPPGVYKLTRPRTGSGGELDGDLDLTTPASGNPHIRIVGSGRDSTIIDADGIDRVLSVGAGRTVTISGLTLRNGYTSDNGGGIKNEGSLTLEKASIIHSMADNGDGGAIYSFINSTLSISESLISGNTGRLGGAIRAACPLTIQRSTITENTARMECGGICIGSYSASIEDTAIIFNKADNDGGGLVINPSASVRIINSTIAANESSTRGGGIAVFGGETNIYNSTIALNKSAARDNPFGGGGGIYVGAGTLALRNALVASNHTADSAMPDDCYGTVDTYGRNLLGDATGCSIVTVTGSWDFLSAGSLGSIGDHGGRTPTVPLLAGSNAIDAATLDGGCRDDTGPLPTDQRGFPRVGACDIGAFEFGAFDPDVIFRHGFEG